MKDVIKKFVKDHPAMTMAGVCDVLIGIGVAGAASNVFAGMIVFGVITILLVGVYSETYRGK